MTYTLIAYKREGRHSARGCDMGGWDSQFKHLTGLTAEEATSLLADLKTDNEDRAIEGTWSEILLYEEPAPTEEGDWVGDAFGHAPELQAAAALRVPNRLAARQAAAEQTRQAEAARARRATEAAEHAQLRTLRAKYPDIPIDN